MAKFTVKIYYETFCYREVEAENKEDAYEQACLAVDATSDEEYTREILKNLHNVDNPQIQEIK
jgi:hypothetical protein